MAREVRQLLQGRTKTSLFVWASTPSFGLRRSCERRPPAWLVLFVQWLLLSNNVSGFSFRRVLSAGILGLLHTLPVRRVGDSPAPGRS